MHQLIQMRTNPKILSLATGIASDSMKTTSPQLGGDLDMN